MRFMMSFLALIFLSLSYAEAKSYVGVGITYSRNQSGDFQVVRILRNSPAHRAGINLGDYIIAVGDIAIHGKKLDEVAAMMKRQVGEELVLTVGDSRPTSHRQVTMVADLLTIECFIEGMVYLRFSGSDTSGYLQGWVGSYNVNWNVSGGRVFGYVGGEPVSLMMNNYGNGNFDIYGWIRQSYITWRGFTGNVQTNQQCIE